MESELWHTIRDFGESLVDDCSKSRLIYHFNASYFEPIESQLKMREDRISYSDSIISWNMIPNGPWIMVRARSCWVQSEAEPHHVDRNPSKVIYLNEVFIFAVINFIRGIVLYWIQIIQFWREIRLGPANRNQLWTCEQDQNAIWIQKLFRIRNSERYVRSYNFRWYRNRF